MTVQLAKNMFLKARTPNLSKLFQLKIAKCTVSYLTPHLCVSVYMYVSMSVSLCMYVHVSVYMCVCEYIHSVCLSASRCFCVCGEVGIPTPP